jgi:hypothetical protein
MDKIITKINALKTQRRAVVLKIAGHRSKIKKYTKEHKIAVYKHQQRKIDSAERKIETATRLIAKRDRQQDAINEKIDKLITRYKKLQNKEKDKEKGVGKGKSSWMKLVKDHAKKYGISIKKAMIDLKNTKEYRKAIKK